MLQKEANILKELSNKNYFPRLIDFLTKDDYNYIVMSYLGPNLESLRKKLNG